MIDLKGRFEAASEIPAPDLGSALEAKLGEGTLRELPRIPNQPRQPVVRVLTIAAALLIAAIALGLALHAIRVDLIPADKPLRTMACDSGGWKTPSPAGVSGTILTSVATSDEDIYVVIAGEGHALLHDGGDGWSTVPTPTSGYFTVAAPPVVPGSQPSSLWLLTGYGVWVSAGDGWSALPALPLPGGDRAVALSVASAQDIWVTTDSGTVLHLDGSSWANSRLPDGDVPTRVLALGPNDVWVGGQRGGDTEPHVPFTAHWDGSTWTDVSAPPLVDSAVTTLAASGGDLWATVETSIDGGSPTKTHLLHLKDGEWHDTATLEGDSYRFNVLAGGTSGIWRYAWTTPSGPPTSIEHWTGSGWERTVAVPNGWDLGGNELWQQAGLGITGAGADVVRMGDKGIVDFRYICNGP